MEGWGEVLEYIDAICVISDLNLAERSIFRLHIRLRKSVPGSRKRSKPPKTLYENLLPAGGFPRVSWIRAQLHLLAKMISQIEIINHQSDDESGSP